MADDELPSIFGSISALKAVTPAAEGPQPGETRADATLEERLSTGLLGYCFRGELRGEKVAVHVLRDRVTDSARKTFQERMDAFVAGLRTKSPANVAKPMSLAADRTAFTTRLCSAGSLADVGSTHAWSLGQRLVALATVAEALDQLHDAGITHGALSPAAVLLDDEGSPWIAGLGGTNLLVGTVGDSADPNANHTYASPEAKVGEELDPRSDIFSLGRVLYFLLTGKHKLFPSEDSIPLEELAECPAGLVRIIRKCTRLHPADRYQTVPSFLADFVRYHEHESVGHDHSGVEGVVVEAESVERLLGDFDPRRTKPVPPLILDADEDEPLEVERRISSDAGESPQPQEQRRSRKSGASEIAVAAGAGLVVLGIFVSFLGGDTGMVLGPIVAFAGAGVVAVGLARRLK